MATFPIAHRSSRNTGLIPQPRTRRTTSQTTPGHIHWHTDPSDALTLRGIPAIGLGVSGRIHETDPEQTTIKNLTPRDKPPVPTRRNVRRRAA